MRDEIIKAIQQMIQALVSGPVVIGSMPPLNGYAVSFAGGSPMETFRTLNTNEDLPIVFNGKGEEQETVVQDMDKVHRALTTAKALPFAADWQMYAIETTSAPQLIGREENINWLYGSSFRIKFYARGVKNG
ncbi:hypothetical protein [Ruthenibacterium lactatiformans]|uniref:hypothetical protein n=1 Tax=Ruthenibacterium lactatiformans TaxID=1550024 RepID=UPI00249571FE|nr:hypothetical protein [Ruthenibacterium lactatiformans]